MEVLLLQAQHLLHMAGGYDGEIIINTPAPAIADAVYNATGLRFRTLPITAEQVLMGLLDKEEA